MVLFKLILVLAAILVVLYFNRPLYVAITAGILAVIALFGIGISTSLRLCWQGVSNVDTLTVLAALYLITFLQRILEDRSQLRLAQQDLNDLFNNRRINATLAPIFIGLLPSAAAVNICAEIVDNSCGSYLTADEKAFVTSYFRHIPESFLPTYPSILLLGQLARISMASFVLRMIPLVVALYALGYVCYIRKIPKETGQTSSQNKIRALAKLLGHLWTLCSIVLLIICFGVPIYLAVGGVILVALFVYRCSFKEIRRNVFSAFEGNMLVNSAMVMVFREFIQEAGAIAVLPEVFSALPIPLSVTFALVFFISTLMIGNNATVAMMTTLALGAVADHSTAFGVFLIAFTYAAMQFSPTHYCIFVALEYFKSNFGSIIRKTLIPVGSYMVIACLYYLTF